MFTQWGGWVRPTSTERGSGDPWQWMDCGAPARLHPLNWMEHTEWMDMTRRGALLSTRTLATRWATAPTHSSIALNATAYSA